MYKKNNIEKMWIQMVFLKEFFEKVNLEKNKNNRRQKAYTAYILVYEGNSHLV